MNEPDLRCSEIENSLLLWAAGDLEPAARRSIERHLAGCSACRPSARAALEARSALLRACSGVERAPDLWPAVRAALVDTGRIQTPAPTSALRRAPTRPSARWARLGVAAAALALFGFWLGRAGNEGPSAPIDGGSPPVVVDVPKPEPREQPAETREGGLRRLAPGETAFSDSAEIYVPELPWSIQGGHGGGAGSPASLETLRPIR